MLTQTLVISPDEVAPQSFPAPRSDEAPRIAAMTLARTSSAQPPRESVLAATRVPAPNSRPHLGSPRATR